MMGVYGVLVLLTLCVLSVVASSTPQPPSGPNIESYPFISKRLAFSCIEYKYTYCSIWSYYPYWSLSSQLSLTCGICGFQSYFSYCSTRSSRSCYYVLKDHQEIGYRCKTNWGNFPKCDIPECSPTCYAGQTCVDPNTCRCLSQSLTNNGVCRNSACSNDLNCYPGTCVNGSSSQTSPSCNCPPGFNGTNCNELTFQPEISGCSVQLFGCPREVELVVGEAKECAAIGLEPPPIWVGLSALKSKQPALTKIQASWEVKHSNPIRMPNRDSAPFIQNSPVPIGVTSSSYTVSFAGSGAAAHIAPVVCVGSVDYQNVQSIVECTAQTKLWSDVGASQLLVDNATMYLNITARVGGQKIVEISSSAGEVQSQTFTSTPATRSVMFRFDFLTPSHCLLGPMPRNCSVFPIFLNETITSNQRIEPTFNNWTDDGSGVDKFSVSVFYLKPNARNLLSKSGPPVCGPTTIDNVTLNNFICDCRLPGVFAIELTVFDRARNYARARKIFNYIDRPSLNETRVPLFVDGTNPNSDLQWITDLEVPQQDGPYCFTARWPGRFVSALEPDWLLPVEPWNTAFTVDDKYEKQFGLRSIDALPPTTGVVAYEFGYAIDSLGGIGARIPSNLTFIEAEKDPHQDFCVAQELLEKEGNTIVLWVNAYDFVGKKYAVSSKVSIHRSPNDVRITDARFVTQYRYEFNSSVQLNINSSIGGIRNITFDIWDKTLQTVVKSNIGAQILTRHAPSHAGKRKRDLRDPCNPGDPTCYCIPLGICYNITQQLVIDNCWMDRHAGHDMEVRYVMYTLSGYKMAASVPFTIDSTTVLCRPNTTSNASAAGIVIGCLALLVLLIVLGLMFMRWRQNKHPVPGRVRRIVSGREARDRQTGNDLYSATESFINNSRDSEYAEVGVGSEGKERRTKGASFDADKTPPTFDVTDFAKKDGNTRNQNLKNNNESFRRIEK